MSANHWIITYYKSVSKAWSDANFKRDLLGSPEKTLLKHFDFAVPHHGKIEYVEVPDQNFDQLPVFDISIFDKNDPFKVKVPLPPAPSKSANSLDYMMDLTNGIQLKCACCCC